MAVMPDGQTATAECFGKLYQRQLRICGLLETRANLSYMTHVRQCLNALRSGYRLMISTQELPQPQRGLTGEDWLELFGACQEFVHVREARVVLDVDHISWCLDRLGQGCVLELDWKPKFRNLIEQLNYFATLDKIIREGLPFLKTNPGIDEAGFSVVVKAIENGVFVPGDLLFYCYGGDTLLTAEITRAYINRYVGGIYSPDEPSLSGAPREDSALGPHWVRETASSAACRRPHGFYVKRLPRFADGKLFATGKDYANIAEVERAVGERWPMSCEAFQLFGVTHKCHCDLWRPQKLALPGFCVREWDVCHIGGPNWDVQTQTHKEREINMLTIGTRVSLPLGTLCRSTDPIPEKVGFGFLDGWKPAEGQATIDSSTCHMCGRQLYKYDGFAICSGCGSISNRN